MEHQQRSTIATITSCSLTSLIFSCLEVNSSCYWENRKRKVLKKIPLVENPFSGWKLMTPGLEECCWSLICLLFSTGAFCIPVYLPYILTGKWMLGRGLCKLWLVMDYLLCTASVFNIVLISYDRFLSVTRAVSHLTLHISFCAARWMRSGSQTV